MTSTLIATIFKQQRRAFSTSPFQNYPRRLSYAHGVLEKPLLSEHISERLRNITKLYPQNPAVISHHQKIKWTYEEFDSHVDHVARGLIALGLKKGDRVGIYSPNNA